MVQTPSLGLLCLLITVHVRCYAIGFPESSDEIIGAGESALRCDFIDIHSAVNEKILRTFQLIMQLHL